MSLEHSPARDGRRVQSDPIFRPPEAARFLGLSESTLAKMRMRGDGPPFVKLTSRACGYRLSSLEKYARDNERQSTSQASAS